MDVDSIDMSVVRRIVDRSPELEGALAAITEGGLGFARSVSPARHGGYVAGLSAGVRRAGGTPVGYVAGSDFKTIWVELGSSPHPQQPHGTPAHHVLGRTLDDLAAGG
ncbi:hypothetical protein [Frankia sp. Cr1]|uniref:hypothetical protein n=1 Tax=Frankia sp. Cr1 TaxID=3073931 RepID=UPI002AD4E499|nr:hypothetical protein [Frankia sp. Cr1]